MAAEPRNQALNSTRVEPKRSGFRSPAVGGTGVARAATQKKGDEAEVGVTAVGVDAASSERFVSAGAVRGALET